MPTRLRPSAAVLLVLATGVLVGLRAVPANGTQEPAAPPSASADSAMPASPAEPPEQVLARLSYQREFYSYDGSGRRDPFQPLLDIQLDTEGPRFDELVLTGLFLGDGGEGMVVVEDANRIGYFLKPGDVVGKATLVQILPDEAVFDVRDFGISRRETLKLQRSEEIS